MIMILTKEQIDSLVDEVISTSLPSLFCEGVMAYGHWIATDGRMIEVDYAHEVTAREIIKPIIQSGKVSDEDLLILQNNPSTTEVETFLFKRGWVRGVKDGKRYWVNGIKNQRLTPKQTRVLVEHGQEHNLIVEFMTRGEGVFKGVERVYDPDELYESLNESVDKTREKSTRFFIYNVWREMPKDEKFSSYQFSLWMDNSSHLQQMKQRISNQLYPNDGDAGEKFFDNDIVPMLEKLEQQKNDRMSKKINTLDSLFVLKSIVQRKSYDVAKRELFKSHLSGKYYTDKISDEDAQNAFERLYRHAMGETNYESGIKDLPKLSDLKQSGSETTERLFVQQYAGWKTDKFPENVKVWRGTNSPTNKIKPGDFVTFDKDYAGSYSRGKYKAIVGAILPSKDLRIYKMDIDDSELVYWPENHQIKKYTGTIPSFKNFWAEFH